jgi:hypothetical protein
MRHFRGPVLQAATCAVLIMGAIAPALAAKIETGAISVGSSNLGNTLPNDLSVSGPGISTYNPSRDRDYSTRVSYETSSVVQRPPTETTPGLSYLYRTETTTRSWLEDAWRYDDLSASVYSQGLNQGGGKWISIAGTVSSSVDLEIAFSLEAGGKFTPTSTPFGAAVPLLASFYFGSGSAPVSPVPGSGTLADLSTLSYSTNTYNSTIQATSFSLTTGAPMSFLAYVYAGSGVSIERFNLSATSGRYDFSTTPRELITVGDPVLIGAETIAPIPEADPAMMLAAGLGLAVAIAGRRRRIEPA